MKLLKSALCVIMAVITIFSCCSVALAATDSYDHLPQVYVTGFASANIYYEDDPEKKPLFYPIDTNRILGNLKNSGEYLKKAVKEREPNFMKTFVYNFLMDSLGMLRFNPDGSMAEGVTVEPTVLSYDGDGKYTFYYDSRRGPLELAPLLDDYIEQVKAETGSDKIELVGSSYGVNVVIAYLYSYQDSLEDIDSVLLCVPSTKGISFFGELLSGEFNVNSTALVDFITDKVNLGILADWLYLYDDAGYLNLFLKAMAIPVLRKAVYEGLLEFAREAIATIPAIWVTVGDEYFESALITMYGEDYASPDQPYADLIAEMTEYHNNVIMEAENIILGTMENYKDLNISIISKYGTPAIPLSKNGNLMEDGFATVEVSSFGATCARYNETLPADYKQAKYSEYNFMSPAGNIDASTGVLPFNTWFIDGLGHSQKNEDYWKLVDAIVYEDLNVFSDPEHPQFLKVSDEDPERLIPVTAPEEKKVTLYDKLWNIVRTIVLLPKTLWNKVFGK